MSGSGRGSKKGGGGGGMPAFSDLIALGSGKSGSGSAGGAGIYCYYGHYKMVLFFTAYVLETQDQGSGGECQGSVKGLQKMNAKRSLLSDHSTFSDI